MMEDAVNRLSADLSALALDGNSGADLDDTAKGRWVSKTFLDILREHVIPQLQCHEAAPPSESCYSYGKAGSDTTRGTAEQHAEAGRDIDRKLRNASVAAALVCSDWAVAHRQAEHHVAQARLWTSDQVLSLGSYLRHRPRVGALCLSSPQPQRDPTDIPGLMAAIGDVLYGSDVDGAGDGRSVEGRGAVAAASDVSVAAALEDQAASTATDVVAAAVEAVPVTFKRDGAITGGAGAAGDANSVMPGAASTGSQHGGGGVAVAAATATATEPGAPGCSCVGAAGDDGVCRRFSALPHSLTALEAEGAAAIPLLLLAAVELPHLELLSLSQLPASWTYQQGALPWPRHAEARLAELLPADVKGVFCDTKLHTLLYGGPVHRRFGPYWSSFEGSLAALLLRRGRQLRELALEAPARSVGRCVLELLVAQRPTHLTSLRLRGFGIRVEPHVTPRVNPARAGLVLAGPLRSLAALTVEAAAAAGPPNAAGAACAPPAAAALTTATYHEVRRDPHCEVPQVLQPPSHHPYAQLLQPTPQQAFQLQRERCYPAPLLTGIGGSGGGAACGVCGLTRLELLSCGGEPAEAEVLEGLTSLRSLSLRDSSFIWSNRPPDLRRLPHLRSLDLRRCDWLAADLSPWEEPLLLPPSLDCLDLAGFSSLTSADLSALERLTSLADMGDITLLPALPAPATSNRNHGDSSRNPSGDQDAVLESPYGNLAALTCGANLRDFCRLALRDCSRRHSLRRCRRSSDSASDSDPGDVYSGSESDDVDYGTIASMYGGRGASRGVGAGQHGRRDCGSGSGDSDDDSRRGGGCINHRNHYNNHSRKQRNTHHPHGHVAQEGYGGLTLSVPPSEPASASPSQLQHQPGSCTAIAGADGAKRHLPGPSAVREGYGALVGTKIPPLVSLTLYGVLPQYISDLFQFLPMLTRLVFGGEAELALSDDADGEMGVLVLRAGELPRLRELDLRVGLLGYVQLVLGPATQLTRLTLDNVEFVDVRCMELPASLRYLSIVAWFGLPELYHLHEGPSNPATLAAILARSAGNLLLGRGRARAYNADNRGRRVGSRSGSRSRSWTAEGSGGAADRAAGQSGSDSDEDDEETSEGMESAAADWSALGTNGAADITRALEAEVERQLLHRVLPPLLHLRYLQLNWDLIGRRPANGTIQQNGTSQQKSLASAMPASPSASERAAEVTSDSSQGHAAGTAADGWPFPRLPALEEISMPWTTEVLDEDLACLLRSCPSICVVTYRTGTQRAVRLWNSGLWHRLSASTEGN